MAQDDDGIRIVIIPGSVRPGNFTTKAAALVADELRTHDDVAVDMLDLVELDLPLPGISGRAEQVEYFRATVNRATAAVIATPEYHGSFSSVIKLAIENLGYPSGISGKPVALLGVASGAIGAVKSLESLRGVCSHVGAIVLPGQVSVASVNKVFDDGRCTDEAVEKRVRGLATTLIDYIRSHICPRVALEQMVREDEA